jgi:hypothetical protein
MAWADTANDIRNRMRVVCEKSALDERFFSPALGLSPVSELDNVVCLHLGDKCEVNDYKIEVSC